MKVNLAGRQIEDVLLDRFDELLDEYYECVGLSDDDAIELDKLEKWNDAHLDYVEKLNELLAWYEENGVEFA